MMSEQWNKLLQFREEGFDLSSTAKMTVYRCINCKNHVNRAGHMIPSHVEKCLQDGYFILDASCPFCRKKEI